MYNGFSTFIHDCFSNGTSIHGETYEAQIEKKIEEFGTKSFVKEIESTSNRKEKTKKQLEL